MLSAGGQSPLKSKKYKSADGRSMTHRLNALFVVLMLVATGVQAQQKNSLTLAEAERLALDHEPGRSAMIARAEALQQYSVAAGELPDPTLQMGIANYPLQSGGFTTEGMTQAQLGIRQVFPPGDSRAASVRRLRLQCHAR